MYQRSFGMLTCETTIPPYCSFDWCGDNIVLFCFSEAVGTTAAVARGLVRKLKSFRFVITHSSWSLWAWKMGATGCPETPVNNCQSCRITSHNSTYLITVCSHKNNSHTWSTIFYVHVTVHRNKCIFNKTNRLTNFPNLFLSRNSTCFGQFLRPSSGVFHYTFGTGMCQTYL